MDDVTLARELERMAGDIRAIGKGVEALVSAQATKAEAKTVEDLERRVRTLEAWMYRCLGVAGVSALGAGAAVYHAMGSP